MIVDFGLAYLADSETLGRVTQGGEVVGTPYYIAPEQGRGEPNIGPAADVYAFGCVLFEMLSGQVPFTAGTVTELVSKHMYVPPPSVEEARESDREALSEDLVELVGRMMAKEAADRPSTEEVYETLGRVLHGESEWKRGRPREFLKARSERAVDEEGAEASADDPERPLRPLVVGIAGDIEDDWRMSLGTADIGCRAIPRDGTVDDEVGVDVVFVPDADPETIANVEALGPVLAGCDPSDLAGATELLQTAAVDVITQPIEASELVEKVERVWKKQKRREEG